MVERKPGLFTAVVKPPERLALCTSVKICGDAPAGNLVMRRVVPSGTFAIPELPLVSVRRSCCSRSSIWASLTLPLASCDRAVEVFTSV